MHKRTLEAIEFLLKERKDMVRQTCGPQRRDKLDEIDRHLDWIGYELAFAKEVDPSKAR